MLKIKYTLTLALCLLLAYGLVSVLSADEKPAMPISKTAVSPNVAPENDGFHPPNHEESYVPLTEEGDGGEVGPTMEELELERLTSKVSTLDKSGRPAMGPKATILWEDFEEGIIPPTDWSVIVNNPYTWDTASYNPYEGLYNAHCVYDETYSGNQDEWLISPAFDLTGKDDPVLDFWWNGSYYWSVDPYPNCTLSVFVIDGADTNFLWYHFDYGTFTTWEWNNTNISLADYAGKANIQLAFIYTGYDGAEFGIDAINVNDDPPPVGRCCFGDPLAPSCEDVTQDSCNILGGVWDGALNCTDDPCPVAGPGDNCMNPIQVTLPADMPYTDASQYTCGRGNDYAETDMCYTYGYGGGEDVVYELTVTEEVSIKMTMDPKSTTWTYCEIRTECVPPAGTCVYYFRSTAGDEYYSEEVVLAAGTYYIIIDSWPSPDCIPDFDFTIEEWTDPVGRCCYGDPVMCADITEDSCTILGGTWDETLNCTDHPCVSAGNDCTLPIEVKIPGDLPYSDDNYTCGRGNVYDATCLGSYDGGEDIIYFLDIESQVTLDIILDPGSTTWTGIGIGSTCPLGDPCIATSTSSSAAPHGLLMVSLAPGSYYLMIDTYPSPDCIPNFTLTIDTSASTNVGDDCSNPIMIKLPGDMTGGVYTTTDSTCGRNDYYDGTCLGSYDGGEEIIYELDVDATTSFIFTLDPLGTTYTGMALDDVCPLSSGTSDCIAKVTNSGSGVYDMSATLDPGLYYLMIDTWPSPNCIPLFDLTISEDTCTPPPNDNCADVTPVTLPYNTTTTLYGDNTCSSNDCPLLVSDGEAWEAFTLDSVRSDLVIDYCGTTPAFELVYVVLADACPCDAGSGELIFAASTDWDLCGGDGNVTMYFEQIPAGTYYIPVLSDHPDYPTEYYEGPYQINIYPTSVDPDYCDADGGCDEYIANVSCAEINNSSDCEGYGDFTDQIAYMAYGVGYDITITIGNGYTSDYGAVWVDWNQDFDFDDAGEAITMTIDAGAGPYAGTITPPMSALPGETRMRVRLSYSSYPGPCGSTSYGECEDYTINVGGEASDLTLDPAAIDFGNVAIDETGSTTLTLGADGAIDIGFDIAVTYVTKPSVGGGHAMYDLKECPFNTGPAPVILKGSRQLLFEGFEAGVPPTGWDAIVNNTYTWEPGTYAPYEGAAYATCMYDDTYSGNQNEWIISEAVDFGGSKYVLDFWWNGSYYWSVDPNPNCTLSVYIIHNGDADTTFLWNHFDFGTFTNWEWNNTIVDLSDYKDETAAKIAFVYTGYDGAQFSVDAVGINPAPLSWLSAVPASGTVPGNGTLPISVEYDATDLDPGLYEAALDITHTGAKGDTTVPVQMTVGGGNNIIVITPDPIYAIMQFAYQDTLEVEVYLGGEFGGGGHVVGDIDLGTVTVNGLAPTTEILPSFEGFTGEVLKLTVLLPDFVDTYPLLWDIDDYVYTVGGDFTAGGSFTQDGIITMQGHKSGDANFDNRLNVLDITYLITHLYQEGPAPQPVWQTGDADGNGTLNIMDITYLINYLYKGGPAPLHP